ncbi:ras-related protein Rab-3C [Lates japonicus]|uniref:Ras-related protein Rab-3C n=1 Tax=Lates japonicus TaxID=270547 RepID=A0AAD3RL24_LATJO|nr:ras-related protein Rab-3C [Lates japonicus]
MDRSHRTITTANAGKAKAILMYDITNESPSMLCRLVDPDQDASWDNAQVLLVGNKVTWRMNEWCFV